MEIIKALDEIVDTVKATVRSAVDPLKKDIATLHMSIKSIVGRVEEVATKALENFKAVSDDVASLSVEIDGTRKAAVDSLLALEEKIATVTRFRDSDRVDINEAEQAISSAERAIGQLQEEVVNLSTTRLASVESDLAEIAKGLMDPDANIADIMQQIQNVNDVLNAHTSDLHRIGTLIATPPAPGVNGVDGKSVTSADMNDDGELLIEIGGDVQHNVGRVKGYDGKDGAGIQNITVDADGAAHVLLSDGRSIAVANFTGPAGNNGQDGAKGQDGVNLAGFVIDRDGHAHATLSNGELKDLGPVVGQDGAPGKDGQDGIGFDDLTVEHDGERGFSLKFVRGDVVKAFDFSIPLPLYRGVFDEAKAYEQGDMVTWGGSIWHANEKPSGKPEVSKSWQLAVKHGREGKKGLDGANGKDGPRGEPGRSGRDLTQMGQDGSKW
jgi:integrin beta 3